MFLSLFFLAMHISSISRTCSPFVARESIVRWCGVKEEANDSLSRHRLGLGFRLVDVAICCVDDTERPFLTSAGSICLETYHANHLGRGAGEKDA